MLYEFIEAAVERHYPQGNLAGLQEDLLRYLAFEPEMSREKFVQLGEEGVVDHVYDLATDYYTQKRESIAQPFHQTLRELKREQGDQMIERVFVDFTDGQDLLRAVADVDEALETNGQEINEALERTAMLQTIDEKWTEHLRELDELKEGIGLRSFGRKDPVVEYKMEAFDLFAEMMEDIGREVVSTVFRAGPVVEDEVQTEGEGPKGRLDARSAKAQHDSAQPDYSVKTEGDGAQQEGAAERDPTTEKQEPVQVADEPGRNEYVTVRNNATGEKTEMKWKYAKKKIKQGWTLVS
jgi:preprotein translocase subunit SecA